MEEHTTAGRLGGGEPVRGGWSAVEEGEEVDEEEDGTAVVAEEGVWWKKWTKRKTGQL